MKTKIQKTEIQKTKIQKTAFKETASEQTFQIPVVIPAYEPDSRLTSLVHDFQEKGIRNVILVDDGSGERCRKVFEETEQMIRDLGGALLKHEINRGKGRALKTAFAYVLEHYPNCVGVVTADSDGQHTADCICTVMQKLSEKPDCLVLGVRNFNEEQVPWKSRFGNKLTRKVLGYVSGISVSDTQTGLRGIPHTFMRELLDVPGERFEFETCMLLETVGRYGIEEVMIRTVYDSAEHHKTHFKPVMDSIRIYRILGWCFIKYIFSSLSSFVIDISLFALLCSLLRGKVIPYIAAATVCARIVSAAWNCMINYKIVFHSRKKAGVSALRYIQLATVQMLLSAVLVTGGSAAFPAVSEAAVKAVVDTLLFLVSYYIQRKYIF